MLPAHKARRLCRWRGVQIWDAPHRPLFLAASLWALIVVAWWPLGAAIGVPPPFEPAVLWHSHELLFGFASAAIGGYLLTALPGWTGLAPLHGGWLQGLVLLWGLARLATAFALSLPLPLLLLANAGYFLLLAAILLWHILLARATSKLGFVAAVLGLGLCDALFLGAMVTGRPFTFAHTAITGIALLIVTIGGRAIPAFTRNWLCQTPNAQMLVTDGLWARRLALALLALALVARVAGWSQVAHVLFIATALALLAMMRGWRTVTALRNPLLAALHLAFLWLPVGLGMIGLSGLFRGTYPLADASHSLTIGAMSGLVMAIAGRAAAQRVCGNMQAGQGFIIGASAIWGATAVRLAAPLAPDVDLVSAAATLWCIGWAAFILGFGPAVTGPAIRPVLSGKKHIPPQDSAKGNPLRKSQPSPHPSAAHVKERA